MKVLCGLIGWLLCRMVLLVEGSALEEFPHSVSSLFQAHAALKERSARLVSEKIQVLK
jgi:hypothetical protein